MRAIGQIVHLKICILTQWLKIDEKKIIQFETECFWKIVMHFKLNLGNFIEWIHNTK